MIHQIYSPTLSTFKRLEFRPGLNLIVAVKSPGATDRQTRNSAGKSSFVEIVHFLLGGTSNPDSIFRTPALVAHSFGMKFDVGGRTVTVERSGEPRSKVRLVAGFDESWPKDATVDRETGMASISNEDWKQSLGERVFKLPNDAPKFSPTFRSMFGFFARRRDDAGFKDPEAFSQDADPGDVRTGLSYLLGLDWQLARQIRELRERERSLKVLRKELKSGVYGKVMEPASELKSKVTVTERRLSKMQEDVDSFRVLPEYRELEAEASRIAIDQSELANQNTIDQETIDSLRAALMSELPPDVSDLERVYKEAGVVVSPGAMERIEAARKFHESIIANRRAHLENDIAQLTSQIAKRRSEMERIDARRRQVMEVLSAHGALDQYSKIQSEVTRVRSELIAYKHRLEVADLVETTKTDLALERAQLHKQLMLDHKDRAREIDQAVLQFEELSEFLSEREGTLSITPLESGPEFRVDVPSHRSGAVKSMQIFCFDVMLQLIAQRRGVSPGFLVHDSHLFDGMDPRQRGKALRLGAELSVKHGFQYIVTLNSDQLEDADVREHFDPKPYLVEPQLTDATDEGGLFGFRFD
jgi:uncharacterized protein YydD (DUF2326 family)